MIVNIVFSCLCWRAVPCGCYSRTPAGRRNVPDWWQWSSLLPSQGGPSCCLKVASWTTRNVVVRRKLLWWQRRRTRRTRVLWICCTRRPFLQHPLRVRTHTSTERFYMFLDTWLQCVLMLLTDGYRSAQSPFYQLPPKVQHYPSSHLLLSSTPPALQQLLGELTKRWLGSFFPLILFHGIYRV